MVILVLYIQQDIASRIADWYSPAMCHPYIDTSCYTPSISYQFLFYVLSANCTNSAGCGTNHIPGTLTLDWTQVIILVVIVVDVFEVLQYVRTKIGTEKREVALATD
jgi:hypothetical protein